VRAEGRLTMGVLERIQARAAAIGRRSWPVGPGSLLGTDSSWGHDVSQFSPLEYGDYIATSNDVYTVVQARARLMSGLQLGFYRGRGNDKIEMADSPAADVYWRVNEFWSAERLARMDELAMGVWGHTAWALEPESRTQPARIWWMKPSQLRPVPHEDKYLVRFLYEPIAGGPSIPFEPHEVVWFRYPNPLDEFAPLAPLAAARLAADTASAMQQTNRSLFTNGLMAGGVIVPANDRVTFSSEQAEDLERQFAARMKGVDKAHRWAVLRYEATIQGLNVTPKDAEYIEGMNMSFRQVCRAYGMQSSLQNDLEHATLSNATAFEKIEWSRTLRPDANLRAAEIREQYLPRFGKGGPDWCEYDYTQVAALQESATEAWVREAQALDRGAITINEWRRRQGMPDVAWGNAPYMPINKAPIGPDGQLQLPAADPVTLPDDEVNPASQPETPRHLDHNEARRVLAAFKINGVKL
jgi:HK97 family phage portal protein